jgi:hypothetical protein
MRVRDNVVLFCKLVMEIPFLVLIPAGLFLAGVNLVILFTGKLGVVRVHSDGSPTKL